MGIKLDDHKTGDSVTVLVDGEKFTVQAGLGDDWEIFEALAEAETSPSAQIGLMKRVLTDGGYARLKELARVDGRVSTEKLISKFQEILESSAKN